MYKKRPDTAAVQIIYQGSANQLGLIYNFPVRRVGPCEKSATTIQAEP